MDLFLQLKFLSKTDLEKEMCHQTKLFLFDIYFIFTSSRGIIMQMEYIYQIACFPSINNQYSTFTWLLL
jgi:hypothetical protein